MTREWTFGQRIGAGFAAMVVLTIAMSLLSVYALLNVIASKDRVIAVNARALIDAETLQATSERKSSASRGFLLARDERSLDQMRAARADFLATAARIKQVVSTDEGRRLLDAVERAEGEHQAAVDKIVALRRTDAPIDSLVRAFEEQVVPRREAFDVQLRAFVQREVQLLEDARKAASDIGATASNLVVALAILVTVLAILLAVLLARALGRQIGTAVGQVQSSSAELQAAANQQASGAKEQATAMSEISTTISELLVTSKQIAGSAQRVAQISDEAARSARTGEGTVDTANESFSAIRRQTDLVVSHMLDLGKKSQQIGAVLDIVSELAEQTNILSINATIEAAGAGEAGRRFAVVADEIRKLADRVAGSTKEIRSLIDEVRGAVNTTVMVTEGGSKAVDSGSRGFGDVATAFKSIARLVSTTTEAAREIELSTKQQASAVEQVNLAIANAAQATKETEASSGQTLQTASQLTVLSKDLLRLIQPQATV